MFGANPANPACCPVPGVAVVLAVTNAGTGALESLEIDACNYTIWVLSYCVSKQTNKQVKDNLILASYVAGAASNFCVLTLVSPCLAPPCSRPIAGLVHAFMCCFCRC